MFYFNVLHHSDMQKAIECGSLKPDYKKLYCCRDLLTDALTSYFNSITQTTDHFNSCTPFLFYENQGLINPLTYPHMLRLKDCLRLIYELTGLKYPLDKNYIVRYFFTQKTVLPISLAEFLSKFDNILADLNLT